jgi:hypothetical protein
MGGLFFGGFFGLAGLVQDFMMKGRSEMGGLFWVVGSRNPIGKLSSGRYLVVAMFVMEY